MPLLAKGTPRNTSGKAFQRHGIMLHIDIILCSWRAHVRGADIDVFVQRTSVDSDAFRCVEVDDRDSLRSDPRASGGPSQVRNPCA